MIGTRTGDVGVNWEVCNFIRLTIPDATHGSTTQGPLQTGGSEELIFLLLSAEGTDAPPSYQTGLEACASSCQPSELFHAAAVALSALPNSNDGSHSTAIEEEGPIPQRPNRRIIALGVSMVQGERDDENILEISSCSIVDHGNLYAANTFLDHGPANVSKELSGVKRDSRRVMWGWISDDDLGEEGRSAQGWSGSLCFPRELFANIHRGIVGSLFAEDLHETRLMHSIWPSVDTPGAVDVAFLGIRPAPQLLALRDESRAIRTDTVRLAAGSFGSTTLLSAPTLPESFELTLELDLNASSADQIRVTCDTDDTGPAFEVIFDRSHSLIALVRHHSDHIVPAAQLNHYLDSGYIPLFRLAGNDGEEKWESLRLRVFVDVSVIEVFANDRFALSSKIYNAHPRRSIGLHATCASARSKSLSQLAVISGIALYPLT